MTKLEYKGMDLGFLHESRPQVLDAIPAYDYIYEEHFLAFYKFMESGSMEEIIYVMIRAFRDDYSKNMWFTTFETKFQLHTPTRRENSYEVMQGPILRKDIKLIKQKYYYSEEYEREDYEIIEQVMEFNQSYNFEPWVDKALDGKTYSKTEVDGVIKYTVEDSPILTVEITNISFHLILDPDSVVKR